MALTITPTVEVSHDPPRVLLTLDTTGYVGDTLEIYRVEDGTLTIVRDSETTPDIGDVTWIGYDYEAPYGTAVTYQVIVFASGASVASATSSTTTVNETSAWLVHPGDPSLSVELLGLRQIGARKRQITQSVQRVLGRPDPVVTADARSGVESSLSVGTSTLAQSSALADLIADGTPLLLNIPASLLWGVTYEWVALGDAEEARVVPQVGARPHRLHSISYLVVARPEGDLTPQRTWADVVSESASWTALMSARATWANVLTGS